MNNSILLYKKLLKFSEEIRDVFLKNVPKFDNQLKFDEINKICYEKLYENIKNPEEIIPLNSFYDEIEGLKDLNNRAYKFFLKPRNKSIKGLDVQLGNKFNKSIHATS